MAEATHVPRPTGHAIASFTIAILAGIAFAIVAREIRVPSVDDLDIRIEMAVHRTLDSRAGDVWAFTASFIGSNEVLIPALALVGWVCARRRRYEAAVVLALDAVVVMLGDLALKHVFARERPHLFDKLAIPTDYSFPSGHSMSAVGVWGVIAAVLIRLYPRHRTAVLATAIPQILSIGLSRIYLGVHWPFDVLGGFLAGTPPLVASVHLLRSPHREVVTS